MIREQDLHLALLRASLGTSAQHDPSLNNLRCHLPSGAIRPLLPSLNDSKQRSKASHSALVDELTTFDDLLLGMPMVMTYDVRWPLDLFLQPADLKIYGALFSYLASLRKTHSRVHACWASLSNAQRARRRWTGLSEGGTAEDISSRRELSRCGWGVVRQMGWFIDTLLEYLMNDVVDAEFKRLKTLLLDPGAGQHGKQSGSSQPTARPIDANGPSYLDFTTLRVLHAEYLGRLLTSSLLLNAEIAPIVRHIIEVCEGLVAQVERWGGDILPDLLSEGSLASRGEHSDDVGSLVQARSRIVADINSVRPSVHVPSQLLCYLDVAAASSRCSPFFERFTTISRRPCHNRRLLEARTPRGLYTRIGVWPMHCRVSRQRSSQRK
jgi:gamma-tubulin complex component 4